MVDYIGLFIGIVLLLLLDRILTYLPFDGYLGKLISLLVLVIIASKNTFLGIIGVALIIKNNTLNMEPMTSNKNCKFKKKYCKNGTLEKNGKTVSIDNLKKSFPNIEFENETCDPCSDTCDFQIKHSSKKITNEENLRAKDSKESFVYKIK